jgi:hypothetical protein
MDFGAIIKAPMQDQEWIKKCLLIGLMMIVPIAGALNAMGWMKETYNRAKAGNNTLPDAGFSYIGAGWDVFCAIIGPFLILIGVAFVMGIVLGVTRMQSLMPVVNLLINLLSLVMQVVLIPVLMFRHLVHRTGFSEGFNFSGVGQVISGSSGTFAAFAGLYFVASLIGGVGIIACCLGAFVTIPLAYAIQANAIAAFERQNPNL